MEEYRQLTGELKVLEKQNDFLYNVELWMVSASTNRNLWKYPVNEEVAKLFLGAPLLTAYIADGKIVGDAHNFDTYTDPETGEPRADFTAADAERIVGSLSEDPADIRTVERDGDTWIVGRGTLWEWYCSQLCDQIRHLAEQGRTMPVSIETLVYESHMDGNVEVMDKFIVLGVTILGVHVAPAVVGARITALQALGPQFKELKIRAASYAGKAPDEEKPKDGADSSAGKNEGVRRTLILNRKQLQELGKRFEGYTVLAAVRDDETGAVTVKMRNSSYDLYSYTMASQDETIAPERMVMLSGRIDLGDELGVDASEYTEALNADVRRANADKAAAETELASVKAELNAMQEAERKRRIKASKAAAEAALAEFNEPREEKVSASAIEEVIKAAEDGAYTECVDGEGCWNGDVIAARDCRAICADEDTKVQKAKVQKNNSTYIWDKVGKPAPEDDGSIDALLRRRGIL